ncbi:MAG TPA: hypothetical protein PK878_20030 [bacterium]|nr:hypothetical protein [bacterium]HPP01845.1 hypothetical protein [bacterium]HXK94504.1 hypothetical protein [bacterium]
MDAIQVYVTLKIPDNIARTALHAARTRLGFDNLASLRRSEFWELGFSGRDSRFALQTATRLVEKTWFFANPNKHTWRIVPSEKTLAEGAVLPVPDSSTALILVQDRMDGTAEAVLDALRALGPGEERPDSLIRGTLWQATFANLDPGAVREAAERLAVTVSRTQGLLANPHYQIYKIFGPECSTLTT